MNLKFRNKCRNKLRSKLSNKIKNKKAFQVGKIFIYILALLIMVFILYYGYKSIINLTQKQEKAECLVFSKELKVELDQMSREFSGTIRYSIIPAPGYVNQICFFDFDQYLDQEDFDLCVEEFKDELICDSWKDRYQNVFLFPDKIGRCERIKSDFIKLDDGKKFLCFSVISSSIKPELTSQGNKVLIRKMELP